ncbi:hypothetical protein [Desulfopila aestuarii]|uniref:Uncharacterized protein n=1 Tax=Desulfopila aestuarii DSM 18488 TaxID=1121416 RepID=A0A1M7Y5G2_9BACT|nr:hypothetical protein [Desulfopila aestuarii]SHO47743.1 hypothetical protein SAMN02745220_01948 [Desulfopila aestuarii DSM 18488]
MIIMGCQTAIRLQQPLKKPDSTGNEHMSDKDKGIGSTAAPKG